MAEQTEVRDMVEAVAGVANAIPVYQDVVQPAAQELGKALQTVAKTVHIALAPVSVLIWGFDQIQDFVSTKVTERLQNVPPENLITPKPNVAGPALEALRYTGHEPSLSDMYANLIAAAMDSRVALGAHPAFVEIIKQLTPDEAKIVSLFRRGVPLPVINVRRSYKDESGGNKGSSIALANYSFIGTMAGCEYPEMVPTYIDNLCRLGLAEVPAFGQYTAAGIYDALENDAQVKLLIASINADPARKATIERKCLNVSVLGRQFASVCTK